MVYIRYKDGRDKIIETYATPIFQYPYIQQNHSTNPGTAMLEYSYILVETAPVQSIIDVNNNRHDINVREILDVTVEVINEHRKD